MTGVVFGFSYSSAASRWRMNKTEKGERPQDARLVTRPDMPAASPNPYPFNAKSAKKEPTLEKYFRNLASFEIFTVKTTSPEMICGLAGPHPLAG